MDLSIESSGIVEAKNFLSSAIIKSSLSKAIFDVAGVLDNTLTTNLNERIYSKPPSKRYSRTGRALGGRLNTEVNDLKRLVINDTRLKPKAPRPPQTKAPDYNYAPMLNRNKRVSRLNTHYADDAVTYTQEKGPKILKDIFDKKLKAQKKK